MTAEELARRLITLIFAGRNRMDMIRRELPRTRCAGWVGKPFRIEHEEDSPFRGPCAVIGAAVQEDFTVKLPLRVGVALRCVRRSPKRIRATRGPMPSRSDSCSCRGRRTPGSAYAGDTALSRPS